MANIHDVARHAGVSAATVSRVVSGSKTRVARATKARVLEAVERLRYSPNASAAHLRTLRTGKLLVTVPDLANSVFALVLQGIEEAAHREGYAVLLGATHFEESREARYASMLARKEADGLIVLGHRLPPDVTRFVSGCAPRRAPVVCGYDSGPDPGVPSVHIDNALAAREVMELLYRLGHRTIAAITGPRLSPLSRVRLAGVIEAANAAGGRRSLALARGAFSIESGAAAARTLLDRTEPPTAIFCFNDEMAMGAIDAVRERGLRVPCDVSVVGFDDLPFSGRLDPPLTTVAQPLREIGEGCARLLLEILSGKTIAPIGIMLPHQLIVRRSTVPPPQIPAV